MSTRSILITLATAVAIVALIVVAATQSSERAEAVTGTLVAGAGDIGVSGGHQGATAPLLASAVKVMTFGDNAYPDGTLGQFQSYYAPSWGAYKSKTYPSTGNHDYHTSGAAGWKSYFGRSATYYSWTLPGWRFFALDSNIARGVGSAQYNWLKNQLAANTLPCVAAYWHHPRFSSGDHGNDSSVGAFWTLLYNARADLILNGHDHDYERFNPQTPSGAASSMGVREFVVGTGGAGLYSFRTAKPNSVKRIKTWGVLRLTLGAGAYDWKFVNTANTVLDSGTATCH